MAIGGTISLQWEKAAGSNSTLSFCFLLLQKQTTYMLPDKEEKCIEA